MHIRKKYAVVCKTCSSLAWQFTHHRASSMWFALICRATLWFCRSDVVLCILPLHAAFDIVNTGICINIKIVTVPTKLSNVNLRGG